MEGECGGEKGMEEENMRNQEGQVGGRTESEREEKRYLGRGNHYEVSEKPTREIPRNPQMSPAKNLSDS